MNDLFEGIVKQCTYKNEKYSVRDNGEVFRHTPKGKKSRPLDNQWTFGKVNEKGYLAISSETVHRIVAFAFLGEPPTSQHVIDHVDTNRQNNRPENLRWVTKLENVLLNPITLKRIIYVCGSVEAFLENPSAFRDELTEPNLSWMCRVSKEEAKISYERLLEWSKTDNVSKGGTLGDWIFRRERFHNIAEDVSVVDNIIMSLTQNAVQRNWSVPSEFPCCPQVIKEDPLNLYVENLSIGSVLCTNQLYTSLVSKIAIKSDDNSIILLTINSDKEAMKPWALAKITFEDNVYAHESLGTFFSESGAEKRFCLAQGLEWTGVDSIDDYC